MLLADVPAAFHALEENTVRLRTRPVKTHRPRSMEQFATARWRSMTQGESEKVLWDGEVVEGPDTEDRETLLTLAKMTYNAYIEPKDDDWYDLDKNWEPVGITFWSILTLLDKACRNILLVGNQTMTAFVDMYSQHQTIQLSSSRSRALLPPFWDVVDQQHARTS